VLDKLEKSEWSEGRFQGRSVVGRFRCLPVLQALHNGAGGFAGGAFSGAASGVFYLLGISPRGAGKFEVRFPSWFGGLDAEDQVAHGRQKVPQSPVGQVDACPVE